MTVDRYTNKDALGAVRELVAKWRHQEPTCSALASQNRKDAFRRCANELEAALAQAPEVRVPDYVLEVLRQYQDGRSISNVHTRQVAREIQQRIEEAALGQEKENE